ncbi:MAG: amino acid adenylation domain-containing protein, partial [Halanaerobiales bacterium]|nr:amino acid adenylation domain-containing protein [Halanaerobiales bacterium]
EEYWLDTFNGEIPVLNMPTDYPRLLVVNYAGEEMDFALSKELSDKLKDLAKKNGATLYMTLLAAYNVLLHKYTNQEDIIVGSSIAGRPHADLEKIIGMFVNTLALRNYPAVEKPFIEFLTEVKESTFLAFENQDFQFEMLVEKLDLERDLIPRDFSRNPLFDTMFVFQNIEIGEYTIKDFKFVPYKFEGKVAKFDLTLQATETLHGLSFNLEYSTKLFKRETIDRLVRHFKNILHSIVEEPEIKLSNIQFLSDEEKERLVYDLNQTNAAYPKERIIHQLIEEQVQKTPDQVAVCFENQQMTYQELNQKANQLARILRGNGVKPDQIVGIIVEHSFEMISGVLGILKAGGAYLPMDSEYPVERIQYMLRDSSTSILLTQSRLKGLANFEGIIIELDDESLYTCNAANLENISSSTDLTYIIYTSGSTGRPKGVMITQQGLMNYLYWASKKYIKEEVCIFPLYSSLSFDLTVTSMYLPLITGNRLIIYQNENKESLIAKIFEDNQVDVIKLTPIHLKLVNDLEIETTRLKRIIVGGEDFKVDLAKEIYEKFAGKIEIYNEYGPTETVVGCMIHQYHPEKDQRISVPIGTPADNVQIYLLNQDLQLMPEGCVGEVYISGDGIARGYLNRPELTDERFIQNPFVSGKRMYKTGDLARRLSDGNLEFLGRIDHQVKIRGYRIEFGEIESQLLKYDSVNQALVVDYIEQDGNTYLVAYLVCTEESKLVISEIREYLAKKLPNYMIPSFFIQIEKVPITSNGKVDRKALPKPDGEINLITKYVAPETEIEKKLAAVWSEVLGVEKVGVNDKFFELGGHSLKAIKIVTKTNQEKLNISVRDILTYETITKICNEVILKQTKSDEVEELTISKKENYNKNFTVTAEYQYYFSCLMGIILEKLKYEHNYEMEKGYMLAVEGGTVITCEYSEDKLWPFEVPLAQLIGFPTYLEKMDISIENKCCNSLEEALEYFDKRLKNNELVLVAGSTYFLNYSPDYHSDPEEWIRRTESRKTIEIIGAPHVLSLVDIRENGYLVYDSTYNYFGEIPKDDFHNAFKGIRAMDFMKGYPMYEASQPYMIIECNTNNLQRYNLKELGKEILQKIIDEFLASKSKETEIKGKKHFVRFGLGAIEEIKRVIINIKDHKEKHDELLDFLAAIFNGWKYKYIFFRDFLMDFDKYYSIYDDFAVDSENSIKQCENFFNQCEDVTKTEGDVDKFLNEIINNLEEMYNDQEKFFIKLQEILNRD